MDYTVIHQSVEKGLEIRDYQAPTPEVYELIANQVWGTSGPVFTKNYTKEKLDNSINPHYLLVYNNDDLFIGMCVLSQRPMGFNNHWIDAYYLQFFSIKKEFQGQGIGKWFLEESRKYFKVAITEPTISYATIEEKNTRSSKVADFIQYDFVNRFHTIIFSRLFPKKLTGVETLSFDEKINHLDHLKDFYKEHCFAQFEYVKSEHPYYVVRKDGEVVAGLLAHKQFWEFKSLPGLQGKLIMNLVPKIPIINRVFNPKYRFVVFEAFYYKNGYIKDLIRLMEHVLLDYEVNSAMLWLDQRSKVFKDLDNNTSWGIIDKMEGKTPIALHAGFHHTPPVTWEDLTSSPFYIAGYDCV